MATSKKIVFLKGITPVGTASYPKLTVPDTKYKATGEYSTKMVFAAEDIQPLIDQYEKEQQRYFEEQKAELMAGDGKSKAKAKALKLAADKPYKPEFDDEGEETGNVVINFKMPARVVREGKPDLILKPDVFDAAGKQLTKVPEVWSGSRLKIAYELRPFNTAIGVGVSMRLKGVQIIELRQGGQRDAASYGFGAEDGYTADDEAPSSGTFGDDSSDDSTPDDNKDF